MITNRHGLVRLKMRNKSLNKRKMVVSNLHWLPGQHYSPTSFSFILKLSGETGNKALKCSGVVFINHRPTDRVQERWREQKQEQEWEQKREWSIRNCESVRQNQVIRGSAEHSIFATSKSNNNNNEDSTRRNLRQW